MSSPTNTCNIYSLNEAPVFVECGMLGLYTINPRPAGAPWGVTVIEDKKTLLDLGDDKHPVNVSPAKEIAADIVNRYPGEGLFLAAEDDRPSAEEVAAAELEFELADQQKIAQAHITWDAKKDRSKIDARARAAARRRNQVVEWATNQAVNQKACPFCGEIVRESAIKCKHCAEWLDGRATNAPPLTVVDGTTGERVLAGLSKAAKR